VLRGIGTIAGPGKVRVKEAIEDPTRLLIDL